MDNFRLEPMYDYVKQLTTLSTGSIVLISTFAGSHDNALD